MRDVVAKSQKTFPVAPPSILIKAQLGGITYVFLVIDDAADCVACLVLLYLHIIGFAMELFDLGEQAIGVLLKTKKKDETQNAFSHLEA